MNKGMNKDVLVKCKKAYAMRKAGGIITEILRDLQLGASTYYSYANARDGIIPKKRPNAKRTKTIPKKCNLSKIEKIMTDAYKEEDIAIDLPKSLAFRVVHSNLDANTKLELLTTVCGL